MNALKVKTSFAPPPIPMRQFDWSAYDDATYDGPRSPVGFGATEQQAIDDLLQQMGVYS